MKNLILIAYRITRNKLLHFLIIVLGIAFITLLSGLVLTISDNLPEFFEEGLRNKVGDIDLILSFEADTRLSRNEIEELLNIETTYDMAILLMNHDFRISKPNSDPIQIYTVGTDNSDISIRRYRLSSDISDNEIALNENAQKLFEMNVGEFITCYEGQSYSEYKVVEVFKDNFNIPVAIISSETMLNRIDEATRYNVLIKFTGNDDKSMLAAIDELEQNDKFEVQLLSESLDLDGIGSQMNTFSLILQAAILLSCYLMIHLFLKSIYNDSMKDFIALRCHGYRASQVFFIFILISATTNILGTVTGSIASILFMKVAFNVLSIDFIDMTESIRSLLLVSTANIVIVSTMVYLSFWKLVRNMPIRIKENVEKPVKDKSFTLWIRRSLVVLSSLLLITALLDKSKAGLGALGLILLVAGYFMYSNDLILSMLNILGRLSIKKNRMMYLAAQLLRPYFKKNGVMVHAIALGIFSLSISLLVLNTIKINMLDYTQQEFVTDMFIENKYDDNDKFDYTIVERLYQTGMLETVVVKTHNYSTQIESVNGEKRSNEYLGMCLLQFDEANKLGLNKQSLNSEFLYFTRELAEEHDIIDGDRVSISIRYYESKQVDRRAKVLDNDNDRYFAGNAAWMDFNSTDFDATLWECDKLIIAASSTNQKLVKYALEKVIEHHGELVLKTYDDEINYMHTELLKRNGFVIVVISILLLISTVGLVLSLYSFLNSQNNDYVTLRRLFIKRDEIKKLLVYQMSIVILISMASGVVLSVLFKYLIMLLLNEKIYANLNAVYLVILIMVSVSSFIVLPFSIAFSKKEYLVRN